MSARWVYTLHMTNARIFRTLKNRWDMPCVQRRRNWGCKDLFTKLAFCSDLLTLMAYVIKARTLMVCKSATANALLILGIQLIFSLLVPYITLSILLNGYWISMSSTYTTSDTPCTLISAGPGGVAYELPFTQNNYNKMTIKIWACMKLCSLKGFN